MIRVVICDDHALVRKGLRQVLEESDHIEVVGEAADGAAAVALIAMRIAGRRVAAQARAGRGAREAGCRPTLGSRERRAAPPP